VRPVQRSPGGAPSAPLAAAAAAPRGMSESRMSDGEGEWVPYAERPGFAGLAPLPAADAGGRVVAIQYTPAHAECLSYLRAVVASGEGGDAALEVTADAIDHNSADYTAWQARWEALTRPGDGDGDARAARVAAALREERGFTTAVSLVNVKNYQLWNHRRKLAQARPRARARGGAGCLWLSGRRSCGRHTRAPLCCCVFGGLVALLPVAAASAGRC